MEEDMQVTICIRTLRPENILRAYFVYEVKAMTLWMQMVENAKFVGMCVLIIAALGVIAKWSEQFLPERRTVSTARRVMTSAWG